MKSQADIDAIISHARWQMLFAAIVKRSVGWLAVCLGWWLILLVLDNLFGLPVGLRLPLGIVGATLFGVAMVSIIKTIRSHSADHLAVVLEKEFGIGNNLLINSLQFRRKNIPEHEQPFVAQTLDDCMQTLPGIQLSKLWDWKRVRLWGISTLLFAAGWLVYITSFPGYAQNAITRYIRPLADRPPIGETRITVDPAGDLVLPEGCDFRVSAMLSNKMKEGCLVPAIVWKEGVEPISTRRSDGEQSPMRVGDSPQNYFYTFSQLKRSFTFRIFGGKTYSRSISVTVQPRPKIVESWFSVISPDYAGLPSVDLPGAPAVLRALAGSTAVCTFKTEPEISGAEWRINQQTNYCKKTDNAWVSRSSVKRAGTYGIQADGGKGFGLFSLARGEVAITQDQTPTVRFDTDNLNRMVPVGEEISLVVEAKDDFGVQSIELMMRHAERDDATKTVMKEWTYLGPPGPQGAVRENNVLEIDPARFIPGQTYILEANVRDWNPAGTSGVSKPLVLRIKALDEYSIPKKDPLADAFEKLRTTVLVQQKALNQCDNLLLHFDEVLEKNHLKAQQRVLKKEQRSAQTIGESALEAFAAYAEGKTYAHRMEPLVNGEMNWVLSDLNKLLDSESEPLVRVQAIKTRQAYILKELMRLLGRVADDTQEIKLPDANVPIADEGLPMTEGEFANELKKDLDEFGKVQEKIIEQNKTLLNEGPEDLTIEEEKVLGEMAREEAKWAKFFEEKLTDLSKVPQQDFADSSLAQELNQVYQEVEMAAESLYDKKTEAALPIEEKAAEEAADLAQELEQNLEKWLPDTPDSTHWAMEDFPNAPEAPLAELPAELEDIIGDLIDSEESLTEEVEDATSEALASPDKGAGWGAAGGPISSMAAKGITGNRMPNANEVGGRSGEGRSGQSSGQMVGDTAEGKGGRPTPTRLDATPFEQGAVADSSKEELGGATGGGKISGFDMEGLRGPAPAPLKRQNVPRLAEQQARIRQAAEKLAMELRRYNLPSGDIEVAVRAMIELENAALRGEGVGMKQLHNRAIDALQNSRQAVRTETGLRREQTRLPPGLRSEILSGLHEGVPAGYEKVVSEYFRAVAREQTGAEK